MSLEQMLAGQTENVRGRVSALLNAVVGREVSASRQQQSGFIHNHEMAERTFQWAVDGAIQEGFLSSSVEKACDYLEAQLA